MADEPRRVVLVAGAAGGVGSEVARVFAERGYDLALTFHSKQEKAQVALQTATRTGRKARLDQLDTTDLQAVVRLVDDIILDYGQIDVVANCVGLELSQGFIPLTEHSPSEWKSIIDVNLMSFLNLSYAAVKHMIQAKMGRILSLGSDSGKIGQSGAAVAAAAHGGMIAFTKSLAREVGRFGVTVNVVCPGPTEGERLDRLRSSGSAGPKIIEELVRRIPMKRVGTAEEIAAAMAFLASKEGGYITGQALSVDGGLSMN